ncbi:predicted protein [Uncinocarpus reesii 1704]|uniref:Uncharacterized protein n=1 Tax=Uncinocarpus reesii (strain UAMH 1704) TaxID=336963 RepID=C4JR50_UNCRE|nr:uncharacterized protein UREG_03532 [Uncinocarpus reesii 1704]EEP78686.1 predicted protein [Uncinocarpus reesii 1704]
MHASAAIFLTFLAGAAFAKFPPPPGKICDTDKECSFACFKDGCMPVACNGLECTTESGFHYKWTQEKKDKFMKEGVCRTDPATDDPDFTKCFRRCDSTSDCLNEEYCNLSRNSCEPKVKDEEECKADEDCETLSCVKGKCGSNIGKDCKRDEDCPAVNGVQGTRLCSKITKKCLEGNIPTDKGCTENAQCGSGCCSKDGTCQYCKKCNSDSECPFSLVCRKGSDADGQKTCRSPPPPPKPKCYRRKDCSGKVRCFTTPTRTIPCNPGNGSRGSPCTHSAHCHGRMNCFDGKCGYFGKNCGNRRDGCGYPWQKKCCEGLQCRQTTPGRISGEYWCM